ncbi:hypothetical protein [Williamsoniiplasma lucivorax]|uniref:Pentapeptide repeat-containing protein n=1 Tax=Williamsoniiplasma lucivorax TaxID=209274 RepID=A0A2S5RDM4_9MOLU|nr:hypothetical protein [Williamsoniiplasma lucivorax]PPE05421.1 hypothetical protein ELUCI_v1c05130 [Williamsoniiplasma lucivorax]
MTSQMLVCVNVTKNKTIEYVVMTKKGINKNMNKTKLKPKKDVKSNENNFHQNVNIEDRFFKSICFEKQIKMNQIKFINCKFEQVVFDSTFSSCLFVNCLFKECKLRKDSIWLRCHFDKKTRWINVINEAGLFKRNYFEKG